MLGLIKTVGIYVSDQAKSVDFYVNVPRHHFLNSAKFACPAQGCRLPPIAITGGDGDRTHRNP